MQVAIVVRGGQQDAPQWLLVYVTAIYALISLYVAAASFKSAQASERAVRVMEASLDEQRRFRWAQFAAAIGFPDGYKFALRSDGIACMRLSNLFGQPMVGLVVMLWETEVNSKGEREVRFSTMRASTARDVKAEEHEISLELHPARATEEECRQLGVPALEQYRSVFAGANPQANLCLVMFRHRADWNGSILVYDLLKEPDCTL